MLFRTNLLFKRKHLVGLLALLCTGIICVAFTITGSNDFDIAKREVLLRRIGHEILLQSGDSTSRVLPVKKITENKYQLSFEKEFTFQPDSLVATTQRLLNKDPLASDYVVDVLNCANASVAYGYAIAKNKKDDIITCLGRRQPVACYIINITFKPTAVITTKYTYLLAALLFLALTGFIIWKYFKPQTTQTELADTPQIVEGCHAALFNLGAMLFDTEARKLMLNDTTIELTKTETRVLRIFAVAPNQVIERSRLQKEIWEDEGVIVGRSLDMFISKLRKKLEADTTVKIAAIRGKGYKLEVGV
jgi:hypothetical protein